MYNDYNDYNKIEEGVYEVLFTIPPCSLATGFYRIEFDLAIPNIKRFTTDKSNLTFSILSDSEYGNKFFLDNNKHFNSVSRPNWFSSIKKTN